MTGRLAAKMIWMRWTNYSKQEDKKEQKAPGSTDWIMRQLKDLNFSVLTSAILNFNLIIINKKVIKTSWPLK